MRLVQIESRDVHKCALLLGRAGNSSRGQQ